MTTKEDEGKMDAAVKVAFATSDMKQVDQHFGTARSFVVYALSPEQARLAEAVEFGRQAPDRLPEGTTHPGSGVEAMPGGTSGPDSDPPGARGMRLGSGIRAAGPLLDASSRHEDKLAAKIEALDGCIAVYCQAVGASAINQLRAKGIQAVKVSAGSEIRDLIEALQQELEVGPRAWLARAIERHNARDPGRFDAMEQEGWIE